MSLLEVAGERLGKEARLSPLERVCVNGNQKCLDERQVGQTVMAATCDWHTLLSKNQVASHSRPSVLWARLSAKIIPSLTLSPTQQEFFLLLL